MRRFATASFGIALLLSGCTAPLEDAGLAKAPLEEPAVSAEAAAPVASAKISPCAPGDIGEDDGFGGTGCTAD